MSSGTPARKYLARDMKILWGRAAARCARCRLLCIEDATASDREGVIGKIAHIVGHSPGGPRYDATYPQDQLDRYENLLILCPTGHDTVDVQPNTYTVLDLHSWKSAHEAWVRDTLAQEMPSIGFAELEIVSKSVLIMPGRPEESFTLTPPLEKMRKNSLTNETIFYVTMGLAKAREVEIFIEHMSVIDPDFPERLKAGFVSKYNEFVADSLTGDALFEALRQFASGGSSQFKHHAAGLAVLCYLFEKCEVFEP